MSKIEILANIDTDDVNEDDDIERERLRIESLRKQLKENYTPSEFTNRSTRVLTHNNPQRQSNIDAREALRRRREARDKQRKYEELQSKMAENLRKKGKDTFNSRYEDQKELESGVAPIVPFLMF